MANKLIQRAEAIEKGERTYFTGKACLRGHLTERYCSTGGCVGCERARSRSATPLPKVFTPRQIAIKEKHKTYLGHVCEFNHSGKRFTTSSACVECNSTKRKKARNFTPKKRVVKKRIPKVKVNKEVIIKQEKQKVESFKEMAKRIYERDQQW